MTGDAIPRDDTRLEKYPQFGTFSPWLVQAIHDTQAAERQRSDRPGNMLYQRIVLTTDVIWPQE